MDETTHLHYTSRARIAPIEKQRILVRVRSDAHVLGVSARTPAAQRCHTHDAEAGVCRLLPADGWDHRGRAILRERYGGSEP